MELWDIYDRHGKAAGRKIRRGEPLAPGEYHLVIRIGIFNRNGELLIQQRQSCKETFPDHWDLSVSGSALAGEDSSQAAHRELLEELGLNVDFSEIRPAMMLFTEHGIETIYLIGSETRPELFTLQKEEVQAVRWESLDGVLKLLREKQFIPYPEELMQFLFTFYQVRLTHERPEPAGTAV